MAEAEIGAGDVPVTLEGKKYLLKCSLEAAIMLTKNNGLSGAVNRCLQYDLDTITDVFAAGLGKRSKALPKAIYEEGIAKCSIPAIRFLTNLAHGGKRPPEEDKGNDPLSSAPQTETDETIGQEAKTMT